jgi:proteasome lid subunit RPN8/RPN11
MHLLLTTTVLKRLRRELRRAGSREIGGLIMGEHTGDDMFRVVEISVQRSGGSAAHFVRDPVEHRAALQAFFAQTGGDYTRFNYLGEWHSHPTFEPVPSPIDVATMQALVEDPAVGVNFLVLCVVRLGASRTIEASATVFSPQMPSVNAAFLIERAESKFRIVHGLLRCVRRWSRSQTE